MNVDVPKTAEQLKKELFESWIIESANGKKKLNFATAPSPNELAMALEMYEQSKPYAHSSEHDKTKAEEEAEEFKRLSGGYDIEDFLAYRDRKVE